MAATTYKTNIPVEQAKVWAFVSDIEKWARLVPGYRKHEMKSDKQSVWTFGGTVAGMTKMVDAQVDITEWNEPSEVKFDLKGLSDKFNGNGHFIAEVIDENNTKMSGHLDITAEGMLGQVTNQVLGKLVPKTAKELTEAIAEKLLEINNLKV